MEDNRPRYPAVCPACNKKIYVCKSIGQEMGMHDFGAGECIYCNTHLQLTFDEKSQSMKATMHSRKLGGTTMTDDEKKGYKKALFRMKAEIHKNKSFPNLPFPYDSGVLSVDKLDNIVDKLLELGG